MMRLARLCALIAGASACVSCGGGAADSATVPLVVGTTALVSPNQPQPAVVGNSFDYDATLGGAAFSDPRKGGLRYAILLVPATNGLLATGGRITGVPVQPGLVIATITTTDAGGGTASQSFPIVVFAAGLSMPVLPQLPFGYTDVAVPLPPHFVASAQGSVLAADNMPASNRTTDNGAALGRVLFYDPRLSVNDRVACASCHQQAFGFGDSARFSAALNGVRTTRRTMALANARFYQSGRFFWDERAATLEDQVLQPIQNSAEMGMRLEDLPVKLGVTSYYPQLFQSAFGTPEITSDRISRALAQFVRSLVSSSSRFDSVYATSGPPNLALLTPVEQQGFQLFTGAARCTTCHRTLAHFGDNSRNTGLDAIVSDVGAGGGRFKPPSLRNVAVRAPYMHDGRFATLREVVEFYDTGVQPNPSLDPRLRAPDGTPLRLNLSPAERAALVAYLETLTDRQFLTSPRFASPFASAR